MNRISLSRLTRVVAVATLSLGPVVLVSAGTASAAAWPACTGTTFTSSCVYTVPGNGTLNVTADGASGGLGVGSTGVGGSGAHVETSINVTSGEELLIIVGGFGFSSTSNTGAFGGNFGGGTGGNGNYTGVGGGGGGGGLSGIFNSLSVSQGSALVVAGGGGASCYDEVGGNAGNADGSGNAGQGTLSATDGGGGGGATQSAGGAAGLVATTGSGTSGTAGTAMHGGDGGSTNDGGSGGGCGGGGGYFGGGGGGPDNSGNTGAGGAGSSYVSPDVETSAGATTYSVSTLADGQVTLAFSPIVISPPPTTTPKLPFTGVNTGVPLALAAGLVAGGGILVLLGRRRYNH